MKTLKLFLLLCFWAIAVGQAIGYDSGNVLSNGGFEKGDLSESANNVLGSYPWFTSNHGGNAIAVTKNKTKSGSYSLIWNPIGWNVKEDRTLEDAGTFIVTSVREHTDKGATTARLSGFLNTSALKPNFRVQVILANDSFSRYNVDTLIAGSVPGWQSFKVSMPVTPTDNGMFIAFMVQSTKGTGAPGSQVYIDDLKLLNFIVGITQWLEPKPGQYVWSGNKNDEFQAHLQELKKGDYKISITFTNVHMDQKHLPGYLKGKRFNDPYMLERWQKYLEAFLPRYGDYIDYLNIGNEVNNYFGKHYEEWSDYLEFFQHGEKVIRRLKPKIKVGIVLESRRESFWKQLEPFCDHLGITYYTPCSAFGKSPTDEALDKNHYKYFARTLEEAIRVAGPKKILITEVGCATHPDIDSSPELQVQFIQALFHWLSGKENKILGISWLAPTDWPYEHTKKALQGYLDAAALQHEPFMKYLTSLGLKYEDGSKKPGYDTFKNEISRYRNTIGPSKK